MISSSHFRKKKKPALRAVVTNDDGSSDDNDEKDNNKRKEESSNSRHLQAPNKKVLSFQDEEEEGGTFVTKKSSESRRLSRMKKRESKKEKDSKNEGNGKVRSVVKLESSDSEEERRLFEEASKSLMTMTGKDAEAISYQQEDERDTDDEEEGITGPRSKGAFDDGLFRGGIPDAAAIHEARKRRQLLREQQQEDYLPLQSSSNRQAEKIKTPLDEEDVDRRRTFGEAKGDRQSFKKSLNHSDEDEEDFEAMQLRKAVGSNMINVEKEDSGLQQTTMTTTTIATTNVEATGNVFWQNCVITPSAHPQSEHTFVSIKSRIEKRLESLDETYRGHSRDLDRIVDEMVDSQSMIGQGEERMPGVVKRHAFYQELQGYVNDLLDCFNHKVVKIKYLEDRYETLRSSMATSFKSRRRQDVRDRMTELAPKEASIDTDALMARAAEREGRRRRREQKRQRKVPHYEGVSSDDEPNRSDQLKWTQAHSDIESQCGQVMSDVIDAFSTLEGVKERFEEWKKEQPNDYNDAYASLSMPKIFSPLIRLQILSWSPTDGKSTAIPDMDWFQTLVSYGMDSTDTDEETALTTLAKDGDRMLLSLLVEKVMMPRLTSVINVSYDALSTRQTLRLTTAIVEMRSMFPTLSSESKQTLDMLTAAKKAIKECIENDMYIPIGYAKQVSECPRGDHARFCNRQFWTGVKLFGNIVQWHGILSDEVVCDLAIASVLNRYLITALSINPDLQDVLMKLRTILDQLPDLWRKEIKCFKESFKRCHNFLDTLLKKNTKMDSRSKGEVTSLMKRIGYEEESR